MDKFKEFLKKKDIEISFKRYCIDALTEYYETGNTSQYFTADSYVIDKTNVGEYRKGEQHDQ